MFPLSTTLFKSATAAIAAGFMLTACGGGGDSSGGGTPVSPPPPPPPPPVNAAPTARADVTPAAPQEGQPFILDASASTDPEGAALTYSWSQVSGPPVTLTASNQAQIELAAAEVTEDTQAVFRVAVSDGTNTSTADVPVTFANIAQTPVFFDPGPPLAQATLDIRPLSLVPFSGFGIIVATEEHPAGAQSLHKLTTDLSSASLQLDLAFEGTFEAGTSFTSVSHLQSPPYPAAGRRLLALETNADRIRFLRAPEDLSMLEMEVDLDVEKPCSATFGTISRLDGVGAIRQYRVGQYGLGMAVFEAGLYSSSEVPEFVARERVQLTQTLCPTLAASQSYDGYSVHSGSILALNQTTNSLEQYVRNFSTSEIQLWNSAPVPTGITSGPPTLSAATATYRSPGTFMLAVYTDGKHEGEHALTVGTLSNDGFSQSTHRWTIGTPTSISIQDANQDGMIEIIIVSSSSPQAIVFQETPNRTAQNPLGLTGPSYMEIGLGATHALSTAVDPFPQFTVLYPDKEEIRIFRLN